MQLQSLITAVTDYYCQEVSSKLDAWLAHLNLPPTDGGLQRTAAVFVILTRWGAWEHLALLCPLWAAGDMDARNRVIDQFHELACLEPDLRIELTRLKDIAEQAKGKFAEQWARAVDAAVR
ncbi:hypothetical protein COO60DRAFT_1265940 [Scenedesmus sp. NREL 46B-D3]|nr:hypothetical protein COO60DRAFT_1265940 [Scenedesmus sp. NREL 46B-D3]